MSEPTLDPPIDPARLERGECAVCGYIYEPVDGDRPRNVAPGTPFNELPKEWRCPNCKAPVSRFRPISPRTGPLVGFEENARYGIGVNVLNPQVKNLLIFGGLLVGFALLVSFYYTGQ